MIGPSALKPPVVKVPSCKHDIVSVDDPKLIAEVSTNIPDAIF
jgi:hypothetical protein